MKNEDDGIIAYVKVNENERVKVEKQLLNLGYDLDLNQLNVAGDCYVAIEMGGFFRTFKKKEVFTNKLTVEMPDVDGFVQSACAISRFTLTNDEILFNSKNIDDLIKTTNGFDLIKENAQKLFDKCQDPEVLKTIIKYLLVNIGRSYINNSSQLVINKVI